MSNIKYISLDNLRHYNETIQEYISDKVSKEEGKGLSTNDFTNELKNKLSSFNSENFVDKEEFNNLTIDNIKDSPIFTDNIGHLNIVDENGNSGLILNETGLYVKDVVAGEHILSNKMDKTNNLISFTDTSINIDNSTVKTLNNKQISILFIGNSLTQDAVAYLPYILKNYYPEIDFKIYMFYVSSASTSDLYYRFTNNRAADIFSIAENTEFWTKYSNSKTMKHVLETYTFDIVCLQEYFKTTEEYTDMTNWNNCKDYIISQYLYKNPIKFISLLHAPGRNNADALYTSIKNGNAHILKNTISEDIIPAGIAIYRALSTELSTLGDYGKLSNDGVHTQEGLPCLIQTYVIICWLLDKLSINKSIYGHTISISNDIYNKINVPGANLGSGVIEGTLEQNLLAQEIAINAFKEGKGFVYKTLYFDN